MTQGNKPDSSLKKPARKFLFDVNDFDDHQKEEEPEVPPPPPPPTFSEAELERARNESLAQGRKEATAESEASRERHVADLLQTISREFSTLFAAEDLRNAQYEAESLRLTLAILQRLFPAMNQKYGLGEIQRVVTDVLETQREQAVIRLEVHTDYVETIRDHVKRVLKQGNISGECQVSGNQALGRGDCRMLWDNGGAFRESTATAEDIERHLQVILAERPRLRDNRRSESTTESQPAPLPIPEDVDDMTEMVDRTDTQGEPE